jgi:hypothetical protein
MLGWVIPPPPEQAEDISFVKADLAIPHGRFPLLAENRRLPHARSPFPLRNVVALSI